MEYKLFLYKMLLSAEHEQSINHFYHVPDNDVRTVQEWVMASKAALWNIFGIQKVRGLFSKSAPNFYKWGTQPQTPLLRRPLGRETTFVF